MFVVVESPVKPVLDLTNSSDDDIPAPKKKSYRQFFRQRSEGISSPSDDSSISSLSDFSYSDSSSSDSSDSEQDNSFICIDLLYLFHVGKNATYFINIINKSLFIYKSSFLGLFIQKLVNQVSLILYVISTDS